MADDHHRHVVEEPEARDDGLVVGEAAIAVNFRELREELLDVVERRRPAGMTGDLDALPGLQMRVDLAANLLGARFEAPDRRRPLRGLRQQPQRLDFLQEQRDRFFEIKRIWRNLISPGPRALTSGSRRRRRTALRRRE
jgi:hypothetical protein